MKKPIILVYFYDTIFLKRGKNSSIPIGKNGGFRVIIYLQLEDKIVLISIYSKTEKESLSDDELRELVEQHFKTNEN